MIWNLIKDFGFLFGRLFPCPVRPGLRRVGYPGRSSPVLVTCNFELTVRKVIQTLQRDRVDVWLLVAPTRGINVWCAASGGHFSTDTVISILRTSGIEQRVDHRKLILPQLSAAGVNLQALKERSGWKPRFGPADIQDLCTYLYSRKHRTAREQRKVGFPLKERFVMGTNLGFASLLFFILPLLVMSIWIKNLWWQSVPLLFLFAVLNSVLVFWLPGRLGVQKGFSLGLLVAAAFVFVSQTLWTMQPWQIAGWAGWMLLLSTYLGYDMPGWSPVWRADTKELILGKKNTHIEVLQDQCIGCALCDIVCPAAVFERDLLTRKYVVANLDACQACGACIENCPKEALDNNFRAGVCSCPTCSVINSTQLLKPKKTQPPSPPR